MAGLFGGYLELVNAIGSGVLYILIGAKAFNAKARHARLAFGSLATGITLGVLGAVILVDARDLAAACFVGIILGLMVSGMLTAVLESIRIYLDKQP